MPSKARRGNAAGGAKVAVQVSDVRGVFRDSDAPAAAEPSQTYQTGNCDNI
jgi:hypothetical protein